MVSTHRLRTRRSPTELFFDVLIYAFLVFVFVITLYPFIYVLSMSVSGATAVLGLQVWLYPKGFSLDTYKLVFQTPGVWQSYYNTVWYAVMGVLFNVVLTVMGAYPLSRKEFFARRFLMVFIAVTMFFSGGLIPLFLVVNKLGLYNTRWAIILPAAVNSWYIIITRVFFQTVVPDSLPEAAKLDGCNDIRILISVVVPLSAPILAVVALWSAVAFWNNYFSALIFLPDLGLQPMTVLLQRILIQNQMGQAFQMSNLGVLRRMQYEMQLKYAMIIVMILPILCVYPFLQRYFTQGVMIGAIKE